MVDRIRMEETRKKGSMMMMIIVKRISVLVGCMHHIVVEWMMLSEMTVSHPRRVREVEVVVKDIMDRGRGLGGGDTVRTEREDGVGEGAGVESLAGQERVELRSG